MKEFSPGCLEMHTNTWDAGKSFGNGILKKIAQSSDIFRKKSVSRYFVTSYATPHQEIFLQESIAT